MAIETVVGRGYRKEPKQVRMMIDIVADPH
jgi:hypothetical protein